MSGKKILLFFRAMMSSQNIFSLVISHFSNENNNNRTGDEG